MTNIKRIQELFTRTKRAVCYPGPEDVMVLRKQLKDVTQEDLNTQWDYLLRAENAVEVTMGMLRQIIKSFETLAHLQKDVKMCEGCRRNLKEQIQDLRLLCDDELEPPKEHTDFVKEVEERGNPDLRV